MIPPERRGCKGCRTDFQVTEAHIAQMLSSPMFQVVGAWVPDNVYEDRIRCCDACSNLQADGYTCALSGCIVRVVAKEPRRSCPQVGAPQWGQYPNGLGLKF
ncbi:hypothetical protein SAMN00790413_06151 [Deinococcus hopiensis KR-140]|uniref:Uncharacterized protein n=1 Tax=Deinococcus hopiensis KR-140 TaxID=695939 RepID=A0A1W1VWJ5_9DEIO|nr:hypothetical protein SAMN00790413_06151 [Deinococcus hopiensis KR-140]